MKTEIVGGGWERWHDWHAAQQVPVIDWYVRATRAAAGQSVLDAACGSGIPGLALAAAVGPAGKLVASDVSAEMLGAFARKAAAAGLTRVETREASAASTGATDASFDIVTCKDGLMYCPDIVGALRELRRVTKPGGRFAFSCWASPPHNPMFTTLFGTLAPYLPGPPPGPDAPGPFRLAAPGELERVIRAAGFTDVTIENVAFTWQWESPAHHWQSLSELAGPLERLVATLPADTLEKLRGEVATAIAPFTSAEGVRMPALQVCASGTR